METKFDTRDKSLHIKKDGRVYQMLDPWSRRPMPFRDAKHNYTERDLADMKVGGSIEFLPMYGNKNPVWSIVIRLA